MDFDEVTPSKGDSVLNLNKSRQRAVYYRPLGNSWVPTQPLPADPFSISYYFAKGFRAKPPADEPHIEGRSDGVTRCPFCEFEAKSPISLRSHLRKHITQTKEETKEK